jgi:hypothetical protein
VNAPLSLQSKNLVKTKEVKVQCFDYNCNEWEGALLHIGMYIIFVHP